MTTDAAQPPPMPSRATKTLVLMRHAKSDWGDSSLSDHDRPLNKRGNRDAPIMGKWLADVAPTPSLVLSSSAVRTQETVAAMTSNWSTQPTIRLLESLYLAGPEAIWRTAASEGGQHDCVMMLGHNPGMSQLTSLMADRGIEMPTACMAIFRLSITRWSEWSKDTDLEFVQFMSPKLL
ncbi:SixA phosphatase family protein [Rubripirellula reticaptiva]|uniref:Histidine phosphatase superfamily (Branch 1) n=1 Tax=Rubripirellula reticaptiva TaxID=2528013 RepID=A0A5C6FB83_9BACT|nr:histidine phosphatase family protein [Rubripirellula reticaptiva]TWU57820.1 Histidine phosphatase superfamily (branch 1) [Rubripirellula reticaptiva]